MSSQSADFDRASDAIAVAIHPLDGLHCSNRYCKCHRARGSLTMCHVIENGMGAIAEGHWRLDVCVCVCVWEENASRIE